jgi:hypothetical protein
MACQSRLKVSLIHYHALAAASLLMIFTVSAQGQVIGPERDLPEPVEMPSGEAAASAPVPGGFKFTPAFTFAYQYDDNIYATDNDSLSDTVLRAKLAGTLVSAWQRHALKLEAGTTVSRYMDYGTEDTEDYWLNLSGRRDITTQSNVFGGVSVERAHEARGSAESVSGDEPTVYDKNRINLGLRMASGVNALTLAGNVVEFDYRNTPAGGGVLFNDDRDRIHSTLGVRASHDYSQRWNLFAQATSDMRDYDRSVDELLYQRNSSGYRVAVGTRYAEGEQLQAEFMVGYLAQDYDDPRFDAVRTADYKASLRWFISRSSHLSVNLDHALEETTLPDSPGYLYRKLGTTWSQRFTDRLFGKFSAAFATADYQQIALEDDYYDLSAGLSQVIAKGILMHLDYRHLQRDSSQPGDDFSRNQYTLSVSGRF